MKENLQQNSWNIIYSVKPFLLAFISADENWLKK